MKKIISIIIAVLMVFCFAGCDDFPRYMSANELLEDIISVELIDYDNSENKIIRYSNRRRNEVLPFDFNKMTVIETMDIEKKNLFVDKLSELEMYHYGRMTTTPIGISLKINFKSDYFLIISCLISDKRENGYIVTFDLEGKVVDISQFIHKDEYIELINNFFNYQV